MTRLGNCRRWIALARHQPPTVRLLVACAGVLLAAEVLATPADADPIDDAFLSALSGAGVNYGDSGNAVSLGRSVCPMMAREGGTFASASESITHSGMSPAMADMFTNIAIQMYCPSAMASIAQGQMPNLPSIPGTPGL